VLDRGCGHRVTTLPLTCCPHSGLCAIGTLADLPSALTAAAFATAGTYILPADDPIPPRACRKRFDALGAVLLLAALGLFNFTWNQAPLVGWHVAYVWASLLVSVVLFVAFYVWERRMGVHALIPVEVLTRVNLLVYTSLWLGWVSFGTFLFYTVLL